MPDRGGRPDLHRLCDSVSGVNWRPTRFEDELTLNRYACCVCHVVPSTTTVLPCSHALCEQCLTGCVVQDGGGVCPMDTEPFCEDECQKLKLPDKKRRNLKAHCWNEADGSRSVGTVEAVLQHFDRDCAFHAILCHRCQRRIPRADIAAHYVAGCSQNSSCASGGQPSAQDSVFTSCYESAMLEKLSALQRQMNNLSRLIDSANLDDISREMKGIGSNIASITRQLNVSLEELKMLVRDPLSDQLSSLQSQMNELVEQSRHHDISNVQEVVCEIRNSQNELHQVVQAKSELMGHMLSDTEGKLKESHTVLLQEFVHALKASECEMKEQVSEVVANICARLTNQQQPRQRSLDSSEHNNECTVTERPPTAAALRKKDIPLNMQEGLIPLKLEMYAHETLKTVEFLRQEIYKQQKVPWVSNITNMSDNYNVMWTNVSRSSSFNVTLSNAGSIFSAEKEVFTFANLVKYRDMHIRITLVSLSRNSPKLFTQIECVKTLGNCRFSFTKITVKILNIYTIRRLFFKECWQNICGERAEKNISHCTALFQVEKKDLAKDAIDEEGKLRLLIHFE